MLDSPVETAGNIRKMLTEEIVNAQRLVRTDAYQMSIGEIVSMYDNHEIIIDPEFQRLFRWDIRACLQSSKPEKNRSDSNHGEIVGGTLFVPCGDSSKVFQPVDQALADVALTVCLAVEAGLAALLVGITGMMPRFRRASRMLRRL